VLDGCEREIDIEVGPPKVVWAGPLHGRDLPNVGVRKPWKLLERYEQVSTVHAQPETIRGDLAHLDGRNGLPTQRGFHLRPPCDQSDFGIETSLAFVKCGEVDGVAY
jgi:hypothetical protein